MSEAISSFISNGYLQLFIGALIFFIVDVFLFMEKVRKKLDSVKEKHDSRIKGQLTNPTPDSLVKMFDYLKNSREKLDQIESFISLNIWGGIIFLLGAILGFILNITGIKEDTSIMLMFVGFTLFCISVIFLIYWYFIKSDKMQINI